MTYSGAPLTIKYGIDRSTSGYSELAVPTSVAAARSGVEEAQTALDTAITDGCSPDNLYLLMNSSEERREATQRLANLQSNVKVAEYLLGEAIGLQFRRVRAIGTLLVASSYAGN